MEEYKSFKFEKPMIGGEGDDHIKFAPSVWNATDPYNPYPKINEDMVNSPAHYTRGKTEVIDVIEDAIADAPSPKQGMLQAQVLKYMMRLWLKSNSKEDAEKAKWYLNRLIDSLDYERR